MSEHKEFTSNPDWFNDRRLGSSAGFFLPYFRPDMKLLDGGCGPGSITLDLAEALKQGEVIAVDRDPRMVARARRAAEESGLKNIRVEEGNLYRLRFPDASFDAVWTSSVIQWAERPRAVLKEILRVLKPGGVYATRDRATRGDIFGNENTLVRRGWRLHYRLMQSWGFRPLRGEKLRAMLWQLGFENVTTTVSSESHGTQEAARIVTGFYRNFIEGDETSAEIIGHGWATKAELARIVEAWKVWSEDPDSYIAMARVENVAWKPR